MIQELSDFPVASNGDGKWIVVTGPGWLMDFQATNDEIDSPVYLQIFDGTSEPATGARPKRVYEVPAAGAIDGEFPAGRRFRSPGIFLGFSSTRNSWTRANVSSTGRVGAIEATFIGKRDGENP